jgi:hypothetical protein
MYVPEQPSPRRGAQAYRLKNGTLPRTISRVASVSFITSHKNGENDFSYFRDELSRYEVISFKPEYIVGKLEQFSVSLHEFKRVLLHLMKHNELISHLCNFGSTVLQYSAVTCAIVTVHEQMSQARCASVFTYI